MRLHLELNIKPENPNKNDNMFLDQRNQAIMLQNFVKEFKLNNRSIISDLFYAMNCNTTKCANCNVQIYNYQTYFFLVFPLEEVRKFKYNNYQYNFNNNLNVVDIYDCFEYDRKINLMSGENAMYCNYCKRNANCYMCTNLITGPEILIILLNRGHGIEFNIKINFPEILNLYNYIQLKDTGFNYKLIGVITHIGESSMSGHFIAYCKDPISQALWHKFNDAIVNEVSDFQNEVINFAMPYLLFYQKV
jgi:ubiquitin C-terminal hydrolase